MSGGTNAGFLDTLALAYHRTGDTEKAREIQHRAISLLPPGESPLRSELETRLAEYESSRSGKQNTSERRHRRKVAAVQL